MFPWEEKEVKEIKDFFDCVVMDSRQLKEGEEE